MTTTDTLARIAADFSTDIDFLTEAPRLCPTCATPMERHGRAWVCPRQRDEERTISDKLRAHILDTASKRIDGCPF
jgi:hypothetical protein